MPDGSPAVAITSRRFAYGVRVRVPGFRPADDAFPVEPGRTRLIALDPRSPGGSWSGGTITALNLAGPVTIAPGDGGRP
jgi:hypothetical protein